MFKCPVFNEGDEHWASIRNADLDDPGHFYWRNCDYGINWYSLAARVHYESDSGKGFNTSSRFDMVQKPTETLLVADTWCELFKDNPSSNRGQGVIGGVPTVWGGPHGRHNNQKCNILWADGHVDGMSFPSLLAGANAQERESGPWGENQLGVFNYTLLTRGIDNNNKWDLR